MKKYVAIIACILFCAIVMKPMDAQAVTFKEAKVYEVSDMTHYDQVVGLSWQEDWNIDKNAGVSEQKSYAKFTLNKKSYVRIKMVITNREAFATQDYFRLYANASMTTPLTDNGIDYDKGDDWFLLEPGTYYMECGTKTYMSSTSKHTTKIMIGAVPEAGAIKVTKTLSANGKSVTISVQQKLTDKFQYLKWKEGKEPNSLMVSVTGEAIDPETQSFTVTKNGTYTILITPDTSVAFDKTVEKLLFVEVNEIGAALKKGTTYKVGNLKYKVVNPDLNGKGTVMVTGVVKEKSSVTIPKTVKIKNHRYKVVKINKNAFKGKSKIKKIVIKSTYITSVGKNAIKGINKKATIKVPKSKLTSYKKLFKSGTGYRKTMKIKR